MPAFKPIHEHIDHEIYGKKISPGYDWANDPKKYKVADSFGSLHIPKNRCYHCGIRFLNSKYAAFCVVCDNEMSPPHEEPLFIVTRYDPNTKPPVKEGYWTTRKAIVNNRIRIPDDVTEEEYQAKMD